MRGQMQVRKVFSEKLKKESNPQGGKGQGLQYPQPSGSDPSTSILSFRPETPDIRPIPRAWISRAFLSYALSRDFSAAFRFYNDALEILERGRQIWKDVPADVRGEIFEDHFIRRVQLLLNQQYMNVCHFSLLCTLHSLPVC